MVSANFTGVIVYIIYNWISKVLKSEDKTHSDSADQCQKSIGWRWVAGLGRSEKTGIKPLEPRSPMFH